jgi:hypothetical protein
MFRENHHFAENKKWPKIELITLAPVQTRHSMDFQVKAVAVFVSSDHDHMISTLKVRAR